MVEVVVRPIVLESRKRTNGRDAEGGGDEEVGKMGNWGIGAALVPVIDFNGIAFFSRENACAVFRVACFVLRSIVKKIHLHSVTYHELTIVFGWAVGWFGGWVVGWLSPDSIVARICAGRKATFV
jgi:hypothetical protein